MVRGSFARIEDAVSSDVQEYKYVAEDTESSFLFGEPGQAWRKDALLSDAGFVFWSKAREYRRASGVLWRQLCSSRRRRRVALPAIGSVGRSLF